MPDELFAVNPYELWALERVGDKVYLKNMTNSAEAVITVDQVKDKTATFHHQSKQGYNRLLKEVPTLTVSKNTLSGVNQQTFVVTNRKGAVVQTYKQNLVLEGTRIGGPVLNFGPTEPPKFEVEPLQHQDD